MDTSEAAVKQRMEDLSTQATNLALTSDLEKSASERVDMFFKFVEVCVCICCCYCCTAFFLLLTIQPPYIVFL